MCWDNFKGNVSCYESMKNMQWKTKDPLVNFINETRIYCMLSTLVFGCRIGLGWNEEVCDHHFGVLIWPDEEFFASFYFDQWKFTVFVGDKISTNNKTGRSVVRQNNESIFYETFIP